MNDESVFTIKRPSSPGQWEAYHAIRKTTLFTPISIAYDPNHPSLCHPHNHHYLFQMDNNVIGILQLEILPPTTCILRTLAITEPYKHNGYGTILLSLAEEIAKEFECNAIHLHSNAETTSFYIKNGYKPMTFPQNEETYPNTVGLGKAF